MRTRLLRSSLLLAALAAGCGPGGSGVDMSINPGGGDMSKPNGGGGDMAKGGGGGDMAMGGGDVDMAMAQSTDMAKVTGCKTNDDCPMGTCDPNTGMCNVCAADGDCKDGMNPRCDGKTGRCVPCLPMNDNCGNGKFCTQANGTYACSPGCKVDGDCANGDGGGMGNMGKPICCNNICVDSAGDNGNCGACGKACANGQTCCSGGCSDVTTDVANCGGCGKACAGANAQLACVASTCSITMCDAGFADCDKMVGDGCEVNTNTDPMNCTACGMACSVAHGAAGCNMACTVATCDPGFADCDKDYKTGCEVDTSTDVANCSACAMACGMVANATPGCAMSKCGVGACTGTFLDCDKMGGNGCEVDGSSDPANCGMCGMACPVPANATASCVAGACGIGTCTMGYTDCDMKAGNGCEVATGTDIVNCGACGKKCGAVANGSIGCKAGVCGVGMCNAGFADCNANPGDGCEVVTNTDIKNCGACGKVCAAGNGQQPTCVAGVCGVTACMAPLKDCDGNAGNGCETNTSNDVSNCGACNAPCPNVFNGVRACIASVCTVGTCNMGFADCDKNPANGCEIVLTNDIKNCGACAMVCALANTSQSCVASACAVGTCNAPFADCDKNPVNGCESNSTNDVNNCKTCGNKCAASNATVACVASACGISACTAPFLDCNKTYADGCEVNGSSDTKNCGACGTICAAIANGVAGCAAGKCGIASCNAPFADCDKNAANGCEVNTNTDKNNCGGCGVMCGTGICVAGKCSEKCLIVGAPSTASWNNDVQAKLVATGAFATVDIFNANTNTPTLATLQQYSSVLVYSDVGFNNATTLGNNLADYFDGGGRVVVAAFANASVPLAGRFVTGNYMLINPAGQAQPAEAAALTIQDVNSPLIAGVAKLTATSGYKSTGLPINGGVTVAKWGSGAPLIVRGVIKGVARADLNFYPPSSAVRADFWVGDGATIMKNALLYHGYCHSIVGKNGATCVSGKVEYCDPANAIVGTTSAQAQGACAACYGKACFNETADCAGAGWGPSPLGMYTCGDAYFGYAAGCSGAAGRIWSICSSNTTYGRWAP